MIVRVRDCHCVPKNNEYKCVYVVSIYFLCKLKICLHCSLSCKLSSFLSLSLTVVVSVFVYISFVVFVFFFCCVSHYFVFPLLHLHIDKSTSDSECECWSWFDLLVCSMSCRFLVRAVFRLYI